MSFAPQRNLIKLSGGGGNGHRPLPPPPIPSGGICPRKAGLEARLSRALCGLGGGCGWRAGTSGPWPSPHLKIILFSLRSKGNNRLSEIVGGESEAPPALCSDEMVLQFEDLAAAKPRPREDTRAARLFHDFRSTRRLLTPSCCQTSNFPAGTACRAPGAGLASRLHFVTSMTAT